MAEGRLKRTRDVYDELDKRDDEIYDLKMEIQRLHRVIDELQDKIRAQERFVFYD